MELKKSYKGFVIWMIGFFAALFMVYSVVAQMFGVHMLVDALVVTVGLIVVAVSTINIKL